MCRCMQTLLLVVAALQLLHVAVAQDDDEDYDLDALLGESRRRMEFFKEFCRFSKDLNNQNTETKCKLEQKELQSQADGLRDTIEQMKQNQRSAEQAETQCRGELSEKIYNSTELQKAEQTIHAEHQLSLRVKDIAHRATTDVALKALNISLQFSAQREQELKTEVARSRELVDIIQVKLTTIQRTVQDGANEASTLAEKVHLENELIDVKSRLIQMDSQLTDLKNLENVTSLQLKQMLDQEKELEISILHQEQQESRGTLESIETYFERSHETLEWERQFCKFKLEATSKLMDSKLELIEATNNFSIRNLNNEIDTEKKKQKQYVDRVINLEDELEKSKTSYEVCNLKETENADINMNITEQLNNCEKQKMDLSSENVGSTFAIFKTAMC